MIALSMVSYVNRTSMSIVGRDIMKEFGLSETQMGSVYSALLLSYAVCMPFGGRLADRFGAARMLAGTTLGSGLFSLMTAVAGWLGSVWTASILPALWAVRFGLGGCAAPLYPSCARMNADWLPETRHARVQGLVLSGAPLGSALTPLLMAWLMTRTSWRWAFVIVGLLTFVFALGWLAVARDRPRGASGPAASAAPAGWAAWKPLFRSRNLMLLSLSYFCLNYFEYIFFYWMFYYFGAIRKIPAAESAIYTSVLLFSMMVAMPLAGWVSDRLIPVLGRGFSRRLIAAGGMTASAVLLFLGTNAGSDWSMVAMLSLALGLAASAEGPAWASAIEAGTGQAGAASGIMNGIGNIGGLIAPVLTPWVAQRAGWSAGLYVGSAVVLAGALAWLFINPDAATETEPRA